MSCALCVSGIMSIDRSVARCSRTVLCDTVIICDSRSPVESSKHLVMSLAWGVKPASIVCVVVDLGSMVADVMHPDLVSLQPCNIDDFMDTVEAPSFLRSGMMLQF